MPNGRGGHVMRSPRRVVLMMMTTTDPEWDPSLPSQKMIFNQQLLRLDDERVPLELNKSWIQKI